MADEPVVVMKFPPMKPGNGVEEKTGMTCILVYRGCRRSKAPAIVKGGSLFKVLETTGQSTFGNKPPDEAGTYRMVPLGRGL